ncbi:MAG: DUF4129 domain-containing protein [Acidimicrobiales bacterium]
MRLRSGPSPAGGELPVPEAGAEEVRGIADEVLADPAFHRPGPGLLVRARDWLFEQVAEAIDRLFAAAGDGPLGWVIVAALGVAAAVLIVRVTRGMQREPGSIAGAPTGPRRPPTDWLADAARFEAAGEWRSGLRCRYRALVASLAASGLVNEVPGRTAGEYRLAVARAVPDVGRAFDGATSLFEVAWYGQRDIGPEEARRFEDLSAEVLAGAGGHR